ncbi:MAG: alpha-L-arabinofuranosidase C-terminal domain-containing protein [bacterium]|nr:alpha-L-arabinofuranosidase C-terminal domain-containing protein [bacterium]
MCNARKHEARGARSLCFSLFLLTAVFSFTHAAEMEVREGPLVNPGFESNVLHEGWSLHVYGAPPTLAQDTAVCHEGRQSLRVSAAEPSDTAFGQEMDLQAGRLYRLTGWIKTQNLHPKGSPVFGTFQIQNPGGQTTLMSGRNHGGDTDWTQESILFRAPPGGRTRIALFFVGFGKGTGTVWFDDIRLEETRFTHTHLRVRRDFIGDAEISRFQYGQFIEYLCDLVPGMWAERICNASFEGVVPYDVAFRKETDFREKPWYPVGAVNRGDYALDEENPFNGKVSQRIGVEGEPCTLGIAQDGLFVESRKGYRLSVYLRQKGLRGPVSARLRAGGEALAEAKFRPTGEWQKYTARLVSPLTTTNVTLALEFSGPGTVWIDQVSLMPEETVGGWRTDVVEALRDLRPGIIRFGGSTTETFDWRNTIGDPDRRVPWPNAPWGGMHPTGAGLEEFVQLCRAVDAEPLVCVRVSGKDPAEGAAQVEYFNGGPDTPMGRLRAQNGHPEPYAVKYWQVGNELGGDEYARELAAFCAAMKAADPTIKLLSAFPSLAVLREAGEYLDYLCPHHYGCADLAGKEADLQDLRRLAAEYAPGRNLKIAVTEWNTTAGDWGLGRAMLWTLDNALACSRYHNLLHRYADLVEIANRSNLTNSFCSGIIQTDNFRLYKTPTYYAQQLYACHAGSRPLQVEIEGDLEGNDVSATLSRDGRTVVLFVVNNTRDDRQVTLDLSAFGPLEKTAQIWTLMDTQRAGERDVTNSFDDPDRVRSVASSLSVLSVQFDYIFPALSLTVLKLLTEV